jgi:twitching motility protein PilT
MAEQIQTPEQLAGVLNQLVERKVSDIYICAGRTIHVRANGEVCPTSIIAPREETLVTFLNQSGETVIKGRITQPEIHPEGSVDGALTCHKKRYRFNFYRVLDSQTLRQTARISLRPLSDQIPSPDEIQLDARTVQTIDAFKQGLVLVCGKTGQGKSTTLAALLQHRADNFREHIITLEQPIEFVLKNGCSDISQREVGISVSTFAYGLRAALRQNPDTILVGEIRDYETADIALRASESGHVVFGTLHTSNAAQSIERFVNLFPAAEQPGVWNVLSTSLKAILCQILVKGCEGGRVAAREILLTNESVSSYIKQKDLQGVRRAIESGYNDYGMQNWQKAAEILYRQGLIDGEAKKEIIALGA